MKVTCRIPVLASVPQSRGCRKQERTRGRKQEAQGREHFVGARPLKLTFFFPPLVVVVLIHSFPGHIHCVLGLLSNSPVAAHDACSCGYHKDPKPLLRRAKCKLSCFLVSEGAWVWDSAQTLKSMDAQVPYGMWYLPVTRTHTRTHTRL